MSLQDIAKKMADDFQSEILRFADQKKTRRVYVAKWTESKDFSIRIGHKCFAYNERDIAFDLCRHINKQQGVLNARVQIIDFKNLVDLPQEEIERLRFYPGYREAKALWDTFHECCCCGSIAPVVHDCIWKGEKSRACEDCLNKYARFKV